MSTAPMSTAKPRSQGCAHPLNGNQERQPPEDR